MLLKKIRTPFNYSFRNVTLILIAINVSIFFLFSVFNTLNKNYFSLSVIGFVFNKMFWQPFTYMFFHADIKHLLFNILGLFFFGTATEKAIGSKEFTLMYLIIGVLCGFFSLAVYYFIGLYDIKIGNLIYFYERFLPPDTWRISLIGASGAIYGILFAYAVIFPRSRIFIWGLIPVPAPILVLAYAIIEFGSQFLTTSNVAHMTHLAGFCFAFLYFLIRMGVNPIKVWKNSYR